MILCLRRFSTGENDSPGWGSGGGGGEGQGWREKEDRLVREMKTRGGRVAGRDA